jgi:anti-sigma regulatory factor (Ser/Thr protein kinase)
MRFSEWIKIQIDTLRSIIVPDEPPPIPPDGVVETPIPDGVDLRFLSNTANLSRARKAVEKFCETTALDQAARDEIGLVVNEALANVMRHAYGSASDRPIEMKIQHHEAGVKMSIRDWGNGVNPATRLQKPHDPLVPGGLGLICLKKLMDDVQFNPQPEGMLLELVRTSNGSKAMKVDAHHNKSAEGDHGG